MTKEQAIKRCKEIIITKFNLDYSIDSTDKEAIETVLSMLKENSAEIEKKNTELAEKNAEIEKFKQVLARNIARNVTSSMKESAKSKEDLEMLNAGWQIELEKKDKIIDLMAEEINETDRVYTDYCEMKIECDRNCKDCIKQYFERKSEE